MAAIITSVKVHQSIWFDLILWVTRTIGEIT